MAIHTAQHLVSAILDTYSLPTLSWSITQFPSLDPPYIELPRQMTWSEVEEVEEKCNGLISEKRAVWVEASLQHPEEDVGQEKLQVKEGEGKEEGDRASRGIPKDYAGVSLDPSHAPLLCATRFQASRDPLNR
jgi:Ser-tRNA(Ala) deacylase AlaX